MHTNIFFQFLFRTHTYSQALCHNHISSNLLGRDAQLMELRHSEVNYPNKISRKINRLTPSEDLLKNRVQNQKTGNLCCYLQLTI